MLGWTRAVAAELPWVVHFFSELVGGRDGSDGLVWSGSLREWQGVEANGDSIDLGDKVGNEDP